MIVAGCTHEPTLHADAIIHNVTIVDVNDGQLVPSRAVVVSDGRISAIIDEQSVQSYTVDTLVDGGGGFLIPSIADVHVHLQSYAELTQFVRYGVGLVVNMSGGPQHLAMREAVASRSVLGPSVVTVGPTLDGESPTNPLFVSVNSETAEEVVDWIAAQGYDGVKVYQQMDAETLAAIITAATNRSLITTGHVSRDVGVDRAINAGQRYVAHGEELAFEAYDESTRTYDLSAVPVLAARLAEGGVTVTPMLAYLQNIPPQVNDLEAYLSVDQMRLVPAATRMSFDRRQGWFANREDPAGFAAQIGSLVDFVAALTVALSDRDVPLVLGTDAGFGGAIPGYSVHEELQALVDAGLTEIGALRTATQDAGRYLAQIDPDREPWGLVKAGYTASLLLLDANPLNDITATQAIRGVMLEGRWIDEEELATIERTLVQGQDKLLPIARAVEDAIIAGDLDALDAAIDSAGMDVEPLISADNCIFLGYRHYYGGNRGLAGRLYERCTTMHPDSSALWIHIARSQESEEDTEGAARSYRRAAELNPWYGEPRLAIERVTTETDD